MIDSSANSLLHLDLLDLRAFNYIGITKYRKAYGDNEVYRIFVKTHFLGEDRIFPLYFDFTDMMIRKCQKELEILECQFSTEHFNSAIIEYLNFDYKFSDWYKIECTDIDKYKAFYKTLEDLSGVLLPTLKLMPSDDFKVVIPDNTLYSLYLNTKDGSQTVESVALLEGFYFNNKVFKKVEEFTAYNVLETLFETNNFSLNIKPGYAGLIALETFSDPSSRIRIKTLETRKYGEIKVRDNTIKPFITLTNKSSYNNEIVIDYESEYGSKIKELIINWLLDIGAKLKGASSPDLYKLFENLNTFLADLRAINDPESDYYESMVNFISDANNVAKLFVVEEKNDSYNAGSIELSLPIEELKAKLQSEGISADNIEVIPGVLSSGHRELHGNIFLNLDTGKYGFFALSHDLLLPDVMDSVFNTAENGERVAKDLFYCIRMLNVKKYLTVLVNEPEVKKITIRNKEGKVLDFGVTSTTNMDEDLNNNQRTIKAVFFDDLSREYSMDKRNYITVNNLKPIPFRVFIEQGFELNE